MLAEPTFADVCFIVGAPHDGSAQRITAHRSLLASRSEHFRDLFHSQCTEIGKVVEVEVPGTTPSAFIFLLKYLYTDELNLDINSPDVIHILRLAHLYKCLRVYNYGTHWCKENINYHNAIPWCVQSYELSMEDLCAQTLAYVVAHFHEIKASASHSVDRLNGHPELMMRVLKGL